MSRRNAAVKRPVLPDPQFNSRLASMMISRLMKHGKKSTAQRILSDAFSLISERTGGNAVELFETAVKKAFGYYVDGQVTAVLGTHTHVPTADSVILPKGTAYQTDVGMTGDYNSVIGMDKENPIHGFVKGYRSEGRFFPANSKVTICGTYIEIDDNTGLSLKILPFQM